MVFSLLSNLKMVNITSLWAQQHYLLNLSIKLHEIGARLHWHTLSVHRLAGRHTFFPSPSLAAKVGSMSTMSVCSFAAHFHML